MKKADRKFKLNKFTSLLGHVPFMVQFMALTVLTTTIIIFILIGNNYTSIRNQTIQNQVALSSEILQMESDNLDQYLADLANFCILPYYDSEFTRIINQKTPLTEEQQSYVKQQMYYYYYTRNDLLEYEIYLINQDLSIGRNSQSQHITVQSTPSFDVGAEMEACSLHSLHQDLKPAASPISFTYYHSLFQVKDKKQQSIVKLTLNQSSLKRLLSVHSLEEGVLLLYNDQGELLYTSSPLFSSDQEMQHNVISSSLKHHRTYDSVRLQGKTYLLISANQSKSFSLYHLIPLSSIDQQFREIQSRIILLGVLIWIFTVCLLYFLSRLLTLPLKVLSSQMHETGQGHFNPLLYEGGSQEITELVESYNSMVHEIDQLIQRTYVAELSEKSAQLTALEAQINPHFLYNTLQAISTEALLNDQPQIYKMITSLASNLRYTIKDAALVPLSRELQYVDNYILLQQTRMDDALLFSSEIEEETKEYLIPKISIHTLIENSIIHGLNQDTGKIEIRLTCHYDSSEKKIMIRVWDNGCGISKEQLALLQESFISSQISDRQKSIGLANLYTRLQLLYDSPALMQIESVENQFTQVVLTLPAVKETIHV